jgi:ketosteroid isomerase-like protein
MKPSRLKTAGLLTATFTALFLTGCASSKPAAAAAAGSPQVIRELLEADSAFSRLAQQRGLAEAFATFAAPDGVQLPPDGPPVVGREAIRREMSGGNASLVWHPLHAEASRDGSLGWTWGTYEFRESGPNGRPQVRTGKYLTVWRRMPDGTWRFAADIGNQASPE